jgi:gliding motility-associated-like protein
MNYWLYGTYTNGSEANYFHTLACSADSALVMKFIPPALPLPQGDAFVSIRQGVYRKPDFQETDIAKTYISQCLQAPLLAGEQYTLSFSAGRFQSNDDAGFKYKTEPFTVAIFGHADCNAVPFGQRIANSNGCPGNYPGWQLLGKTKMQSKGDWVQQRIKFTAPPNINVIAIGPDCSLLNPGIELTDSTTRSDFYVYYIDDVHLLTTKDFPASFIQPASGRLCTGDSVLTAPAFANASYQWYKDSIAIVGATQIHYTVPHNSQGYFNVRVITNDTCFMTEPYFFGPDQLSRLAPLRDTGFCKGETVVLTPVLSNVTYTWNGNMDTVVKADAAGTYNIKATDANGCSKTVTVEVKELDCNNAVLYMPSAFTPNDDGKNDLFRIPQNNFFTLSEFCVYDRWGRRIFMTKNKASGWNGTVGGKESPAGTYVYFILGRMNNKKVEVKGTVILIR